MTEDLEKVETALHELLTAIDEHERRRVKGVLKAMPINFANLENLPSRAEIEVRSLVSDPLGAACRQAIRRIGQHVFDVLGSTDGLSQVLERVADRVPARSGARSSIMDHAWDGVGSGDDRWWA